MKEGNIKSLIKKYKSGTSSLKEEQFLFNYKGDTEPEIEIWSTFVKTNKKEVPNDLNNKLWKSFEKRNSRNHRFKIGFMSAAASIIFIISLAIGSIRQNELTDSEKEVLLNEAKSMFADVNQEQAIHNIIIENELIVVYTKSE